LDSADEDSMKDIAKDWQVRLQFHRVNDQDRQMLRELWPRIEPQIRDVLTGFYQHLGGFSNLAEKLGGQENLPRLITRQTEHWRSLFSGDFNEEYLRRVTSIGQTHQRVGLEPRWYLGGYGYLLRRLTEIIDLQQWHNGKRRRATLNAVQKAVFLDMDIAISVYQDAEIEAQLRRQHELEHAIGGFDSRLAGLLATVGEAIEQVDRAAHSVAGMANETSRRSIEVSAAAEQASGNVEAVAAASEELSASIAEINQRITNTTIAANQAVTKANQVNETVRTLNDAADKIGNVIKLISDIASQTNLLALNATIEAARAGEAGKGFAVVANEVKNLAGQTAKATTDIGEQVAGMQEVTNRTADQIGHIVTAITEINEITGAIAHAMEEQSAATREISRSVLEAVDGTRNVTSNIAVVSQNAESTGSETQRAVQAVELLVGQSRQLREEIGRFFEQVRRIA